MTKGIWRGRDIALPVNDHLGRPVGRERLEGPAEGGQGAGAGGRAAGAAAIARGLFSRRPASTPARASALRSPALAVRSRSRVTRTLSTPTATGPSRAAPSAASRSTRRPSASCRSQSSLMVSRSTVASSSARCKMRDRARGRPARDARFPVSKRCRHAGTVAAAGASIASPPSSRSLSGWSLRSVNSIRCKAPLRSRTDARSRPTSSNS